MVCYASEMKLYVRCLQYEDVKVVMNMGKVMNILTGDLREAKQKLTPEEDVTLREYSRYRDDTEGILVLKDAKLLEEIIQKMCTIYPKGLVYNVVLSHRSTSHLDVCYHISRGGSVKIYPRKSIDSPVGFGPALTNMSEEHKSNFILGEYILDMRE